MSALFFAVASAMLLYDFFGHTAAALAQIRAAAGSARAAYLWNTYSIYVWPRIANQTRYNIYWSMWHGTTWALFLVAYWLKP